MSDEQAVMVEPTACAIHAAYRGSIAAGERVVVLGSEHLGLLCVAAIRQHFLAVFSSPLRNTRSSATLLQRSERTSSRTRTSSHGPFAGSRTAWPCHEILTGERFAGGADVVFDCVGSATSLGEALNVVRPGGRIVLVGMPGPVRVDLAPLWQREITLLGAYAYGMEKLPDGPKSTFELAFELVQSAHLERLVTASYPLDHYEDAVRHAANAGRRGAVKVVFDLRRSNDRAASRQTQWIRRRRCAK